MRLAVLFFQCAGDLIYFLLTYIIALITLEGDLCYYLWLLLRFKKQIIVFYHFILLCVIIFLILMGFFFSAWDLLDFLNLWVVFSPWIFESSQLFSLDFASVPFSFFIYFFSVFFFPLTLSSVFSVFCLCFTANSFFSQ